MIINNIIIPIKLKIVMKNVKNRITQDDYIKANKAFNRQFELEKNGGRWIAKDRIHQSKKSYNRKDNKRIDFDCCPFYLYKKSINLL